MMPLVTALALASTTAVEQAPAREWYGHHTLLWDAAAASLVFAGPRAGGQGAFLGLTGVGLYLFGAPYAHWSHGNVGRGFLSLGLRATLPFTFAVGACQLFKTDAGAPADNGCAGASVVGLIVGVSVVTAIDASALAYAPKDPPRLLPAVSFTRGGVTLGVSGAF